MSKNAKWLESLTKYCLEHPDERFWQALQNWSEYAFIFGTKTGFVKDLEDTFYKD